MWEIQTETNNIIQLQFEKFEMEIHSSGGGCYDYVEVIDGQLTSDHGIFEEFFVENRLRRKPL